MPWRQQRQVVGRAHRGTGYASRSCTFGDMVVEEVPNWPPRPSVPQPESTGGPPHGGPPHLPGPWSRPRWPAGPAPSSGTGPGGDGGVPARAAWWAVPGALAAVVLGGVGASVGQAVSGSTTSPVADLLGEIGLWAAMFGTVVFVSRRYGRGLAQDFGLAVKRSDPLWGAVAMVCALVVVQVVLLAFSGTKFAGTNVQILTQQKGHEAGLVIVGILVAVGAPFFEELFFRGYLRVTLQRRFGAHRAIWIQALVFGLAHLGESATALGNVSVVVAMALVGVVLGYTAKLTGRLAAGMTAHCLFNLVAVVSVL